MEAKTSSKMSEVFGRLLAGSFIYEAEENRSSNIKRLIAKTKKWVGEDDFKMILNSSTENLKAPIFACIDMAIIGKLTQDTKELFKGLEPANRIIMENVYLKFTGQDPFDQKRSLG